jgi:hypothetical protein
MRLIFAQFDPALDRSRSSFSSSVGSTIRDLSHSPMTRGDQRSDEDDSGSTLSTVRPSRLLWRRMGLAPLPPGLPMLSRPEDGHRSSRSRIGILAESFFAHWLGNPYEFRPRLFSSAPEPGCTQSYRRPSPPSDRVAVRILALRRDPQDRHRLRPGLR